MSKYADSLMSSAKVRQLSNLFEAPQYEQQFVELARQHTERLNMSIRARCALTGAKDRPADQNANNLAIPLSSLKTERVA